MSIKITLHNQKAEKVGEETLNDKVFGVEVNNDLLHQAFVRQISNERQVLAHAKTRSEVRGGGRKPWRQKGTGRARAGSSRSPIWIGGGVTFGPDKNRNFSKNINKKMRQKAIHMVLSDKVKSEKFALLDNLELKDFKTKDAQKVVGKIEKILKENKDEKRSLLIINEKKSETIKYSLRNLAGVEYININNINLKDLLRYRSLVMTLEAKNILESRLNKVASEKKEEKKDKQVKDKK